ncbi:MAG: hypothetical protein GY906_17720 [bacterium]|nr:hypothetical protein [bacterium]
MDGPTGVRALLTEATHRVQLLGVLHERVDFAALVRWVLDEVSPSAVAVELPTTLREPVLKAIARLPQISVVLSEDQDEDPLIWVVAPGDPLVEAMRWAHDNNRPVELIDPDIPYRGRHRGNGPDPYLLWSLEPAAYLEILNKWLEPSKRDNSDLLRERGMAYHLSQLADRTEGEVVAVLGAAHLGGVARELGGPTAPPLARQHRSQTELCHLHPDSMPALMSDAPLIHAVYEKIRDGQIPEATNLSATITPKVEIAREGLRLITGEPNLDIHNRSRAVVDFCAARAAVVGRTERPVLDRRVLASVLWNVAALSYTEQTREETNDAQRDIFLDFASRYARVQGQLLPGLFEWVIAARGVADDNFAWEVFDVARTYPWQEPEAEIPSAKIDGDNLDLGTRKVRFRRRFFRVKQKPIAIPIKQHAGAPKDPADWLKAFGASGICSYPPEDIVVEDFGRHLKEKAKSIISAERSRTEQFTGAFLDGVDIRETTRRWHEGKIWVKEDGRSPGDAGSVAVIFDEDSEGTDFPYLMTWLGEHEQESDMALYATNPAEQIVGPGIMRATYGGFMLTYPPGRLFDVWQDSDYQDARTKAEVLLMAAVDYSLQKLVVHVGKKPPSRRMSEYAARQSRRIVHIPIGTLSPSTIRTMRVVHILAGYETREIAKDYVW